MVSFAPKRRTKEETSRSCHVLMRITLWPKQVCWDGNVEKCKVPRILGYAWATEWTVLPVREINIHPSQVIQTMNRPEGQTQAWIWSLTLNPTTGLIRVIVQSSITILHTPCIWELLKTTVLPIAYHCPTQPPLEAQSIPRVSWTWPVLSLYIIDNTRRRWNPKITNTKVANSEAHHNNVRISAVYR